MLVSWTRAPGQWPSLRTGSDCQWIKGPDSEGRMMVTNRATRVPSLPSKVITNDSVQAAAAATRARCLRQAAGTDQDPKLSQQPQSRLSYQPFTSAMRKNRPRPSRRRRRRTAATLLASAAERRARSARRVARRGAVSGPCGGQSERCGMGVSLAWFKSRRRQRRLRCTIQVERKSGGKGHFHK